MKSNKFFKVFFFTYLIILIASFSCCVKKLYAASPMIWNSAQFGKMLTSAGILLNDDKQIRLLTVDPTAGAGVAAPIGSIALRDNGVSGEFWFKYDSLDTEWTNVLLGNTGWSLTGNAGTTVGTNFLGTTDLEDLQLRTNNVERLTISDIGLFTFTPLEMQSTGNVGAIAGSYNQFYMGQNFTSTIGNNYYGPYLQPTFNDAITGSYFGFTSAENWAAGSSVTSWTGLQLSPSFQAGSTIGTIVASQFVPTISAGTATAANINGYFINPNIQSNFLGYQAFTSQPGISTVMTNGYNGFSDIPQFAATSSMATNYKGFQVQPNVDTGATWTSGVGFFSGPQVDTGVTINDYTAFQDSSTIDSDMANYTGINLNHQGTGDRTNYNGITLGGNGSGDITGFIGLNLNTNISGTVTNYTGGNIQPTLADATNVTGFRVDNSSITSPNQKSGVQVNDGSLSVTSNYNTGTLSPGLGGFGTLNAVGGNFTVAAGFPVTGGAPMIGTNLGVILDFQDDMPADFFGGILGTSIAGFLTQISAGSGVTADRVNFMAAGAQVGAGSTGGTISNVALFSALGILPSAGTLVLPSLVAYEAPTTLCGAVTGTCYGVKIDDPVATNIFAGTVQTNDALILQDPGAGTNTTTVQAATLGASYTLTLPTTDGGVNEVLTTDGSGVLSWQSAAILSGAWSLLGNAGTVAATNFLGTTDAIDLVFRTTNTERFRITAAGALDTTLGVGVVHSDASGILTSSAVDLSADVTGILPIANGGTNKNMTASAGAFVYSDADSLELSSVGTDNYLVQSGGTGAPTFLAFGSANQLFGTNAAGTDFENKAVTATSAGALTAPGILRSNTSLVLEDPGAGTNTVTVQSPTLAGDYTLTLPTDDGASNQVLSTNGSGVLSWATASIAQRSYVQVSSSNGYGSTNTKVMRYSNTDVNVGSNITYADSATNGNSFTINADGLYCMSCSQSASSNEVACGFTKNESGVGTTIIYNINAPTRLAMHFLAPITGIAMASTNWCGFLQNGDVIRVHGNGSATGTASYDQASIVQVSN